MEYRQLGSSGVRVSVIGLGTNRFGSDALQQKEVNNLIDAALDLGVNHIDMVRHLHWWLVAGDAGCGAQGRWDRFFVASKFVNPTGQGPNLPGDRSRAFHNASDA